MKSYRIWSENSVGNKKDKTLKIKIDYLLYNGSISL